LVAYKSAGVLLGERPVSVIHLFDIVSRQNRWLSVRQSTIAGNIANANTPGYKALDVEPFEKALEMTRLSMNSTHAGHLAESGARTSTVEAANSSSWDVTHSGNSVSIEQELINAGEVNRAYRLNTSIAKAFHRMILASAKV
jgi:flagellar basal-body rod protein FlgB